MATEAGAPQLHHDVTVGEYTFPAGTFITVNSYAAIVIRPFTTTRRGSTSPAMNRRRS